MAKSKKFRVAVSGDTIDGRVIEPEMLTQSVETFDPKTYGVRVNVEHIRGLSGDKPFGMVGDIIGLSTQEDSFTIGGQMQKRTALYAEVEPNDRAVELNKADQKVYSSIEILPNFAGSGKFGLIGLALTDTPASIGTERLQFSKVTQALLSAPHEVDIKFEADASDAAVTEAKSFFSTLFAGLKSAASPETPPAKSEPAPTGQFDFSAFSASMQEGFTKLTGAIEASNKTNADAVADMRRDLDTFKGQIEQQPSQTYTPRQPSTGGTGTNPAYLAEF